MNENYGSEFADVSTYTEGGIYPSECTSFRSHPQPVENHSYLGPGVNGECRDTQVTKLWVVIATILIQMDVEFVNVAPPLTIGSRDSIARICKCGNQ